MKKFTYSNNEKEGSKPTRTGFRIVVHESISRFPVTNTRITFFPGGRSAVTKMKGMCFIDLEPGTYSYTVQANGFPQVEGAATVTAGVMQLLYIKLAKEDTKNTNRTVR